MQGLFKCFEVSLTAIRLDELVEALTSLLPCVQDIAIGDELCYDYGERLFSQDELWLEN